MMPLTLTSASFSYWNSQSELAAVVDINAPAAVADQRLMPSRPGMGGRSSQ